MYEINKLQKYEFIAGDYKKLKFNIFDDSNAPITIGSLVVRWELLRYGNRGSDPIIQKVCTKFDDTSVILELTSSDTRDLKGFTGIQRVTIECEVDREVIYEGIITIL